MPDFDPAERANYILDHGVIVSAETEALALATLALVEQQRIANLIAIVHGGSEGSLSTAARDLAYLRLTGPDEVLHADIMKGLGIA